PLSEEDHGANYIVSETWLPPGPLPGQSPVKSPQEPPDRPKPDRPRSQSRPVSTHGRGKDPGATNDCVPDPRPAHREQHRWMS
ncbi:MAG: hypothetical protein ACO4AI_03255, partial [Prochlorothrix sp.]